jgi:uncharacterized protein YjaG (DUF416 family)
LTEKLQKIVNSRKDFYLFKDEPRIDGDDEFKLLDVMSPVFDQQFITHVKTIHAGTLLRLSVLLEDKQIGEKMLDEVIQTARTTLKELESAKNKKDNPLLSYILGEALLVKGIHLTIADPISTANHETAKPLFAESITQFESAAAIFDKVNSDNANIDGLRKTITRHLDHLKNPRSFITEAQEEIVKGNNTQALTILQTGTLLHRNSEIWTALLESAVRGDCQLDAIKTLVDKAEKIIEKNNLSELIAISRTIIMSIEILTSGMNGNELKLEQKNELVAQIQKIHNDINSLLSNKAEDEFTRAKAWTVQSKLLTLQQSLFAGDKKNENLGREAIRLGEAALVLLSKKKQSAFDTYEEHEYKSIAYQSLGYNAVLWLPEYRTNGFIAYAAAIDELNKLPATKTQMYFLGSPLLNAASRIDGDANETNKKIIIEEQAYRVMLSKFIEGTFTWQFGEPEQASNQFNSALQASHNMDTSKKGAELSADEFNKTSGFDSGVTFRESLVSYSILANLSAKRKDQALTLCLQTLNVKADSKESSEINIAGIEEGITNAQSPLFAYALAKTLDEYVLDMGINYSEQKRQWIELAKKAFKRAEQILDSPKLKRDYPHLVTLVNNGNDSYSGAKFFLAQISKLKNPDDNLNTTVEILTKGLGRHPNSKEIWNLYILYKLKNLQTKETNQEEYHSLLQELHNARQDKILTDYLCDYYEGYIYELLGNVKGAFAAYEKAVKNADTPKDLIRSRSKFAEIRTRIASVN